MNRKEMGYMDLGCGLGVKEGLDSVPQEPESLTSIDDEHPAQGLHRQLKSSAKHHFHEVTFGKHVINKFCCRLEKISVQYF